MALSLAPCGIPFAMGERPQEHISERDVPLSTDEVAPGVVGRGDELGPAVQ